MANEGLTAPSRFDNDQAGSGYNDLFLKQFTGEILSTFEEANVFKALHTIRTITSGKSAQFPVTGVASANYHNPGENIIQEGGSSSTYLSDIAKTEKVITIDNLLIASTMLYNLDDVKNHYDIRSIYATELGRALAKRFDTAICKVFVAAARDGANLTQTNKTGGQIDIPNGDVSAPGVAGTPASFTAQDLINAFFVAAQKLDEMTFLRWIASVFFVRKNTTSSSLVLTAAMFSLLPLPLIATLAEVATSPLVRFLALPGSRSTNPTTSLPRTCLPLPLVMVLLAMTCSAVVV
jgi:hypothetical protein